MSDGSFLQILIFAGIAAFVGFRLFNVLGRRTGHERPPARRDERARDDRPEDKVVPLPGRRDAPAAEAGRPETGLASGLTQIKLADPTFDKEHFLSGARGAFEMVLIAFAKGDLDTLKPLLAPSVFDSFAGAVRERAQAGHTRTTTLVAIDEATIIEAEVQRRVARVTVKFVSQQINATLDGAGTVVDGDPVHVERVVDLWTFERNTRSSDPNWALVATRSPN